MLMFASSYLPPPKKCKQAFQLLVIPAKGSRRPRKQKLFWWKRSHCLEGCVLPFLVASGSDVRTNLPGLVQIHGILQQPR